jgi:hypothetical protein
MALSDYADVLSEVANNLDQLMASEYPEDLLREFADGFVPIYYSDILDEWRELPLEESDRWQEVGADSKATIFSLMSIDLFLYYEDMFTRAYTQLSEEEKAGVN